MHAALSTPSADTAVMPPHTTEETRSEDELLAVLARAAKVDAELQAEFARQPDIRVPGCAALLALTGPEEVRALAIVRVSCKELADAHANVPDTCHIVPLEVPSCRPPPPSRARMCTTSWLHLGSAS